MEGLKKHYETLKILGSSAATIIIACIWLNEKFNQMEDKFNDRFSAVDQRLAHLEQEIAIIKTVLIMKDILPRELAVNDDN